MVREFVRRDVDPVADKLDREDIVPHDLIDKMKGLGLFGITVPEEYGGLGLDYTTFASIFEELSKGLMSITGAIGTHHILTYVLTHYGTEEQKRQFLPDLASGKKRGGLALTEPAAAATWPAWRPPPRRWRGIRHQRARRCSSPTAGMGTLLPAGQD